MGGKVLQYSNEELINLLRRLQAEIDSRRLDAERHSFVELWDDFISGNNTTANAGAILLQVTALGTPTAAVQTGEADHPGIVRYGTGSNNGNNVRLHVGDIETRGVVLATEVDLAACLIRLQSIASAEFRFGVGDNISGTQFGSNSAVIEFDPASDSHWVCFCKSGGVKGTVSFTSVTVAANTWYLLEVKRNSAGNWEFYINDVHVATSVTQQPTAPVQPGICLFTRTGASKTFDLDFFAFKTVELGARHA